MRFDDMLTTVLAAPSADAVSRQIVWRQLVDILAQERRLVEPELRMRAYEQLETLRTEVAPVVRASVARSVAQRTNDAALVRYFAIDDPLIAAEILRHAQLSVEQWRNLISELPMASRSLLRARRDLPPEVVAALAAFGPADFALTAPSAEPGHDLAPVGTTQIADVVARIEAFRARKAQSVQTEADKPAPSTFELETDEDGLVIYTTAFPREPIIGLNLALAADQWVSGIDGYAAGAFNGRSPFRSARLQVHGHSLVGGDWRLDGDPIFNPTSGRFLGYHCAARRPHAHEHALPADVAPIADNLRQMVHELRTPLNAIIGFAEMIERQMLGPVDAPYRTRATQIRTDGAKLLTAIEDIDLAARLDVTPSEFAASGVVEVVTLLTLVGRELAPLSDIREVHLRVMRPHDPLNVVGDRGALHRLLTRLLSLLLGLSTAGESLSLAAQRDGANVILAVSRPRQLMTYSARALLAEGNSAFADAEEAPLLGLGFGLRLITKLAEAINVKFHIDDEAFTLILIAAHDSAAEPKRSALHNDDGWPPS